MKQRPPQARGWTRFGLHVAELAALLPIGFVLFPCAQGGGLLDGAAEALLESVMESTTAKYRFESSGNSMWNAYRDGLKSEYPDCPIPSAQ